MEGHVRILAEIVSLQALIEVHLDGAQVERSDGRIGKEALSPLANHVDSLIILEHVLVLCQITGTD